LRGRHHGRGQTICGPWHYVPVLARKPGSLGNGAPFKDWVLPAAAVALFGESLSAGQYADMAIIVLGVALTAIRR
jgi:hypothetical protein